MRSLIKKLNERSFTSQDPDKSSEEEMKLRESGELFSLSEEEFSDNPEDVENKDYSDDDDDDLTFARTYSSVDSRKSVSIESIVERYFSKLEK